MRNELWKTIVVGVSVALASGFFFFKAYRSFTTSFLQDSSKESQSDSFNDDFAQHSGKSENSKSESESRKKFIAKPGLNSGLAAGSGSGASASLAGLGIPSANAESEKVADSIQEMLKNREPLRPEEVEAVQDLVQTFVSLATHEATPDSLVSQLKRSGLKPKKSVDENEETGRMIMVRTAEALPGTRYFHAQFFETENLTLDAQHVSFEIRPGKNSEAIAMAAIQKAFDGVGEPEPGPKGFKEWKTKNCKTIWMKVMTKEDLQGDRYNAYSIPEDIGAIRVAQENDPHCHDRTASQQ